jgi:hypothetical protein
MGTLDDIIARVTQLPPDKQREVWKDASAQTRMMKWVPNPGPQTEAYFSKADVLLYGGEPGGGKSQLILGLAFNEHQRTLIMRRAVRRPRSHHRGCAEDPRRPHRLQRLAAAEAQDQRQADHRLRRGAPRWR